MMKKNIINLLQPIDNTDKATGVFILGGDAMYVLGSTSEIVIDNDKIKSVVIMLTELNYDMIETLAHNIAKLNVLDIEVYLYYPDTHALTSYIHKCDNIKYHIVNNVPSNKLIVVYNYNEEFKSYSYIIKIGGKLLYFAGNITKVEESIRRMGNRMDEWYQSISNLEELSKDYTFRPFLDKIISLDGGDVDDTQDDK